MDRIGVDSEEILVQNDEIGTLAGLDASQLVLHAQLIGPSSGIASDHGFPTQGF